VKTIEEMTDDELTAATLSEDRDWMMYQAADGHTSAEERSARSACNSRLKALRRELRARNLPIV
jgi:hypothetical protein